MIAAWGFLRGFGASEKIIAEGRKTTCGNCKMAIKGVRAWRREESNRSAA